MFQYGVEIVFWWTGKFADPNIYIYIIPSVPVTWPSTITSHWSIIQWGPFAEDADWMANISEWPSGGWNELRIEIIFGRQTSYLLEAGEPLWPFTLLQSADSKLNNLLEMGDQWGNTRGKIPETWNIPGVWRLSSSPPSKVNICWPTNFTYLLIIVAAGE